MVRVEVIPASLSDVDLIAPDVRQSDLDEIEGALHVPIKKALIDGITGSRKASKIVVNGQVVAVFGDADHADGIGVPWLISTVHVERYPKSFLSVCKMEVADMLTRHKVLLNFVDCRNTAAIRWLKWLGFEFSDAEPYGVSGELFYPFTKGGANVRE